MKTACYDWHASHGGRMVDFAGWQMPVQYTTIIEEHHAVRQAAGLFDIAHMGRLIFRGPDACRLLDRVISNDATKLEVGQIRYALVTNENGCILDDVLAYRLADAYLLVVNASNREKIVHWIEQHREGFDVSVEDVTTKQFMLAIQGPLAGDILNPLTSTDVTSLKYYFGIETQVLGTDAFVSRTGYTGEDGFEVIVPVERAVELWQTLIDSGKDRGLKPAGLGCRDTLRLEAAMPLYGHEMDESVDPWTAGLGFGVRLKAGDFIGKAALTAAKEKPRLKQRVGLELEGKRIAREGAAVYLDGENVGTVTSGTFSPTLEKPIAMAYLPPENAAAGTVVEIDVRGKRVPAVIVALPFYKRGEQTSR
ncbi:MAG: glycine cleavage system aminomethyltransferase GcvT [Planctomycetes bacterium]|nr:glycine cleavage system aminomethyltransferase GcvT [Planctomycetota bacterium]